MYGAVVWILKIFTQGPLDPPHTYVGPFAGLKEADEYIQKRRCRNRCVIIALTKPEEF